jgi:hypothetical protein
MGAGCHSAGPVGCLGSIPAQNGVNRDIILVNCNGLLLLQQVPLPY